MTDFLKPGVDVRDFEASRSVQVLVLSDVHSSRESFDKSRKIMLLACEDEALIAMQP